MNTKKTTRALNWFHFCMVFVWAGLIIPTILWWSESVLWVALMSIWANLVGHWSAYQASRAEERIEENGES